VPVAPPAAVDSPDMVRWVQTSLQQLGYKPGAADGEMGSRTAAAIRRYEEDNSLPVTGKMSVVLVDSLKQRTQP
jgi:localization factor PodJL